MSENKRGPCSTIATEHGGPSWDETRFPEQPEQCQQNKQHKNHHLSIPGSRDPHLTHTHSSCPSLDSTQLPVLISNDSLGSGQTPLSSAISSSATHSCGGVANDLGLPHSIANWRQLSAIGCSLWTSTKSCIERYRSSCFGSFAEQSPMSL